MSTRTSLFAQPRLATALLAASLVASLAACGGRATNDPSDPGTGGSGATSGTGGSGATSGTGGSLPEACTLPPEAGSCDAYFPAWYHEPALGLCLPFVYGGCGGNENRFDTRDDCLAACRGGTDELDACAEWSDCELTSAACCGTCGDPTNHDLVALRVDAADAFSAQRGCELIDCAPCPLLPPSAATAQSYYPACVAGQCTVRDVREQPFTACTAATDCRLRCGAGCCESCGSGADLIAVRVDLDASSELCGGVDVACADCDCVIPETSRADCVGGRCTVVWSTACDPSFLGSCNADPVMAAIAGTCNPDGTCTCAPGRTADPSTGRCF